MIDLLDFQKLGETYELNNHNELIGAVNDHIVRLAVMTERYPRHVHPNSDEIFIGVEGIVIIETDQQVFELSPGMCLTIPGKTAHSTRPKTDRSVNLTIERKDTETVFLDNDYQSQKDYK
ncbi:cupin domain-containing protein [Mucilaginibacter litoreus]|uniref:Cupin domain-containing protein n=1 Tax=Mucilaginibacter litoreus TaxID=1048221 RepID=A0ABW3AY63_9SPHI